MGRSDPRAPQEIAKRFEIARQGLGLATQEAVSAAVFADDPKRRTRYNTMLRTLQKGGTPQWRDLGPLTAYFAAHGYHVLWLLFGREPSNVMQSGRACDLPLEPAPTPTGIRFKTPAR